MRNDLDWLDVMFLIGAVLIFLGSLCYLADLARTTQQTCRPTITISWKK